MIEAKRLAYEDLAKWYADPAFATVPMKGLLSDAYAAERRRLIDPHHANPHIGPGDPRLFEGDTIYLTTADRDGMMVSLIQSNYRGMGSGLVPDHLGFMFQDRGELFSLDANAANVYAPGGYGGYQAIERLPGRYAAASEMRKDGAALAY